MILGNSHEEGEAHRSFQQDFLQDLKLNHGSATGNPNEGLTPKVIVRVPQTVL